MKAWQIGVAACAVASCFSGTRGGGAKDSNWQCSEGTESCSCRALRPGWEGSGTGRKVDACLDYDCCILSNVATESTSATCECSQTSDCAALVATMRNAEQVISCPPGAERDAEPTACAAVGENCELRYLSQQSLEGCCAGSVCDLGGSGVRVCRAASADEEKLARECSRTAYSGSSTLKLVQGSVATSVGTFEFTEVQFSTPTIGPGGCVAGIGVTLSGAGGCRLELDTAVVDGAIRVTKVTGSFSGCSGFRGGITQGFLFATDNRPTPFSLNADAVSCDWGGGFVGYCASGRFEFLLEGSVDGVEFMGSQIVLEGVSCVGEPEGSCPAE